MLRLIMQYETVNESRFYNGSHSQNGKDSLNLNFRVFEVDCPELEKALKETQGTSNSKKLMLLGIEIAPDKPKPAVTPLPAVSQLPAPTVEEQKANALKLKETLGNKHRNGHRSWSFFSRKTQPKPLPLPG